MTVERENRPLTTFLELVRIDSPSGEEGECARYCERVLVAAGCEVTYDGSAVITGSDVGNLIATLPGDVPAVLILSAHLDCVEPCRGVEPVVRDGMVFSAGDTVLGSDDKAGLAAALECVRRLSEEGGSRPTVRCVFTVQEEVGLRGAKALAPVDMRGDLCLVLDADGSPGGIVIAAPTHHTFTAEFEGRAAHAGVEPEAGVSAIAMAAAAISRITIGRIDEATTANIGSIHGGTATNVMAASVTITGECRSTIPARAEQVRADMEAAMLAAASEAGGRVEIEWTHEYAGFSLPDDSPAVRLVTDACRDSGLEPRTFSTGGGSDANVIAASGTPTVALSCGMSGVHGTGESIAVSDLEALTRLCVATARRLAHGAV